MPAVWSQRLANTSPGQIWSAVCIESCLDTAMRILSLSSVAALHGNSRGKQLSWRLGDPQNQICFFLLFSWLHHMAWGIFVPQPGVKPTPPEVEVWSLKHRTAREVPKSIFYLAFYCRSLWTSVLSTVQMVDVVVTTITIITCKFNYFCSMKKLPSEHWPSSVP